MSFDLSDMPEYMTQAEFNRYIEFKKHCEERRLRRVRVEWVDGRSEVRYCTDKQISAMQNNSHVRLTLLTGE